MLALAAGVLPSLAKSGEVAPSQESELLDCNETTLDAYGQGPFYTADAPDLVGGQLAEVTEQGQRTIISGRIFDLDCAEYIPNTKIDIWHANDAGDYDNNGYNLRGVVHSNEQGFYMFETVKPGKYLNGANFRPSHIHFKITPPGFAELTTQLYFEGDREIPGDFAASMTSGTYDASFRIIPLVENTDGVLEGTWDIVINGDGIAVGMADLHIDKGVLYRVSPNPFTDRLHIRYGVFKEALVSLLVYDMRGVQVAILEEKRLQAEQYDAYWQPRADLPNGHYFIALKINDIQVHYQKVMKLS